MKNTILFLLLFFFISVASSQDIWIVKDSINGAPRSVATSFVANGEGFVATGLDASGFRRKMYSYTYWQDDWDSETSIGGVNGSGLARGSASSFSLNNKGYVCLGQGDNSPFLNDLWEYNPNTKVWTQKASFIGEARRSAVAFVIDTLAYVGTGIANSGLKKDMFSYNANTNSWSSISDFGGTARKEAVAWGFGYQAFVATGDDGIYRDDFWMYTPATDSWTQKANFPGVPRKGAVAWGIFPSGFVTTGEDGNFNFLKDLWEYNFYADTWTQRADFIGPARSNAIAFVLQGIAFVGSGYDGIFYDDMYAYTRVLGVNSLENSEITIFPNPVKDVFNVQSKVQMNDFQLFDNAGRNVSNEVQVNTTNNGFQVYRNSLPAGNYSAVLTQKETGINYTAKVIFL